MPDTSHLQGPKSQTALNVDILTLVADAVICTDEDGRVTIESWRFRDVC